MHTGDLSGRDFLFFRPPQQKGGDIMTISGKFHLRIPGPTPIPRRIQEAMARPMTGHRSREASDLIQECSRRLSPLFGTQSPVLLLAGSGTAALEAAAINAVPHGGRALAVVGGAFGERFAEILERAGVHVVRLEIPWGEACDPAALEAALRRKPDVGAVFLTHCETSTGVLHPVEKLTRAVRRHSDALVIVDGVSSIGGVPFHMDEWGVDVVVTGSQKALMLPPGLAAVAVSPRAWETIRENPRPRYYLDLTLYHRSLEEDTTPFTPPLSLMYGLRESLNMLEEEGLPQVYRRHERLGRMARAGLRALGLRLLAREEDASPTVTAVLGGETWTVDALRGELRKLGVVVAGGQKKLKEKIFRIGHMGSCDELDLLAALAALEMALARLGASVEFGVGTKAAQEVWLAHVQRADH
jgi:aspartate aminotransferase-like enzyme